MKKTHKEKLEDTTVTPSCGNVFEDLGLPDSEELFGKSIIRNALPLLLIEEIRQPSANACEKDVKYIIPRRGEPLK